MAEPTKTPELVNGEKYISIIQRPGILNIDSLKERYYAKGVLHDPKGKEIAFKRFLGLPKEVAAALPGSYVDEKMFASHMGEGRKDLDPAVLVSERKASGIDDAVLSGYKEEYGEGGGFGLNVFHGSFNKDAREVSMLGNQLLAIEGLIAEKQSKQENVDSETQQRAQLQRRYQELVNGLMDPVVDYQSGDHGIRIVEDCIATGETIAGAIAMKMLDQDPKAGQKIRIDVAVATTQGILLLREFGRQNHLDLEINVGHLAYSLSYGVQQEGTEAREHANYLTYHSDMLNRLDPELQKEFRAAYAEADLSSNNVNVVADMGDNCRSLPQEMDAHGAPWNSSRIMDEGHGMRSGDLKEKQKQQLLDVIAHYPKDPNKEDLDLYANGGWHLLAYLATKWGWNMLLNKYNINVTKLSRYWAQEDGMGFGVAELPLTTVDPRFQEYVQPLGPEHFNGNLAVN